MKIIKLSGKRSEDRHVLVDDEDFKRVKDYSWSVLRARAEEYAFAYVGGGRKNRKRALMHRYIMNAPKGKHVDHINGNTFDNRRSNLRIVTPSQNSLNRQKDVDSNNTSGRRGVDWHRKYKKWRSRIKIDNKSIHLGSFKNKTDAIKVREQAEHKYL